MRDRIAGSAWVELLVGRFIGIFFRRFLRGWAGARRRRGQPFQFLQPVLTPFGDTDLNFRINRALISLWQRFRIDGKVIGSKRSREVIHLRRVSKVGLSVLLPGVVECHCQGRLGVEVVLDRLLELRRCHAIRLLNGLVDRDVLVQH